MAIVQGKGAFSHLKNCVTGVVGQQPGFRGWERIGTEDVAVVSID